MILYARSWSYSILFPNFLTSKRPRAYLQLMVTTIHMRLLEFSLQRRASMNTFMTVHGWILSIILAYWCTKVSLATVSGEQWNNWLGTDIGEIWRWLKGAISSYLCPSPLFRLWRGIPNLKLSSAIEVSVILNVGRAIHCTADIIIKHMNRTLRVHHYYLVRWFIGQHSLSNCQYLVVWEAIAIIRPFVVLKRGGMLDVYELMVGWSCDCILLSWDSHWAW